MSVQAMANGQPSEGRTGSGSCVACRGTGRLISGLGGEPHEVTCPWCEGTGERIPGIDAQEHPAEAGAGAATRHDAGTGDDAETGDDAGTGDDAETGGDAGTGRGPAGDEGRAGS